MHGNGVVVLRLKARKDANQKLIEHDLCLFDDITYKDTSQLGNGFPDLEIGYHDDNYLFEVKDGDQPPSKRELTEAEKEFHKDWLGQVSIVHNVLDILYLMNYPASKIEYKKPFFKSTK